MKKEILKAILQRKSVRQYTDEQLTTEEIAKIKEYIADGKNFACPFGSKVRIELIKDVKTVPVKKAPIYAVLITPIDQNGLIDAGYIFEKFILFIEMMGLNTCQIGMFKREQVQLEKQKKEKEMVLLCTPIGHGKEKSSFLERTIKSLIGSNKRKEINQIFFANKDKEEIKDEEQRKKLEYVRWAPSALNSQPWRIVIDGGRAHFHIGAKEHARIHGGLNIHTLDIGIALYHYEQAFEKSNVVVDTTAPAIEEADYLFTVE